MRESPVPEEPRWYAFADHARVTGLPERPAADRTGTPRCRHPRGRGRPCGRVLRSRPARSSPAPPAGTRPRLAPRTSSSALPPYASAVAHAWAEIRARRTSFTSLSRSRSMPSSSTRYPEESLQATTRPPRACTFSVAYEPGGRPRRLGVPSPSRRRPRGGREGDGRPRDSPNAPRCRRCCRSIRSSPTGRRTRAGRGCRWCGTGGRRRRRGACRAPRRWTRRVPGTS